jgi:hypothetical protein
MKYMINKQGGFAVVYGLIILMIATVGGTSILFMTMKDRVAGADYAGMRSSSEGAIAACKAFEGQCLTAPDVTLATLKNYIGDHSYKWLLGASAANANSEQKIKFYDGTNAPSYSAQILGYDSVNSFIVIKGTGYDGMGGKKTAIASYQLGGLVYGGAPSTPFGYSLFLGGAMENCNAATNVTGDVYLSLAGSTNPQHLNSSTVTINGNLKTAPSANKLNPSGGASGTLIITKNAFFQCPLEMGASINVQGKAGFTQGFTNFTYPIICGGDAYFIESSDFSCTNCHSQRCATGQSNKICYYKSPVTSGHFYGFQSKTSTSFTADQVAAALGMTASAENPDTVKIPTWGAGVVKLVHSNKDISNNDIPITVDSLLKWWDDQNNASKLYKNLWLVVQQDGNVKFGTGTGAQFTKKLIWITGDNILDGNTQWCDCTYNGASPSNTFIYVNGSGHLNNWGVPITKNFRGYIYVNSTSTSQQIFQFGANANFYGAINIEVGTYDLNTGPLNLICDPSAASELASIGIIRAPSAASLPAPGLSLVDLKIRPTMLSIQR